jgi:hypothetical protein
MEEENQLLALPLATDGTSMSQFHCMELIAVKTALEILTKDARKKEYNWVSIGCVENAPENDGRSHKMAKEANHLEELDAILSQEDSESDDVVPGVGDKLMEKVHVKNQRVGS